MPTDASGERVSKYEIIRLLGSGGMGEVYLARDTVLNREVAIKFVSRARLADDTAEQRLLHEARAAAALDHPSICPIYDVHVDDAGRTCIVMQYVEGEMLSRRLARGPLPLSEALALARDIADALATAHAGGIVHRDLKPQNVIVTPGGRPKLLDFGIAQTQVPPDAIASVATHTDTGSRVAGGMVGTPAYMSPEQVLQKPVDGRSDLFSLGAVLYECLTGQPAFLASTDIETWARVVYAAPPPPSSFDPRVPPRVDALVMRLLAKEPAARFASAAEVIDALKTIDAAPARVHGWTFAHRAAVAALAVGAIVLTGFATKWLVGPDPLPEPPSEARTWYDRGTEHIRNGAYFSARRAFGEAVKIHDGYVQAHARLAEAQNELDEERDAQRSLLRVADLLPDPASLPEDERHRLAGIRAIVSRDFARATAEYQAIADLRPRDRGAWLDLGRAREAAGQYTEARKAYARALEIDTQYPTAHLRVGMLAAREVRRDDAFTAFAEAERLYGAASDMEGRGETLLQRAMFLNGLAELEPARQAASAAAALAKETGNQSQAVRAALLLTSITASQGGLDEARRSAQQIVDTALQSGLETIAADGLIELGTVLGRKPDVAGAETQLRNAINLANGRGARRVSARATLQLASLYAENGRPPEAIPLVNEVLPFLRDNRYRRLELNGLNILSRVYERLGEYSRARTTALDVLRVAEGLNDDSDVSDALETLAGLAEAGGDLPGAARYRDRLESLHRRQQNTTALGFDLLNRAELLASMGRFDAADRALRELQAHVDAKTPAFVPRARRMHLTRAIAAVMRQQFADAETEARLVLADSAARPPTESVALHAATILAYAHARIGSRPFDRAAMALSTAALVPRRLREVQYLRAAVWLSRGDARQAIAECETALQELTRAPSDEAEWRFAAIGAAAAARVHDSRRRDLFAARARAALDRVRAAWKADAAAYDARPDLVELRRETGLDSTR